MVFWSRLYGLELSSTPWLCACRPEKIEERDGAQSGVATCPLLNRTPWPTSQSTVLGVAHSVCLGWSSVRTTRMLGLVAAPAAAAGVAPASAVRVGTAVEAATAAAPARNPRRPTWG